MAQTNNRQQLVAAMNLRLETAARAVKASAMTIAAHGVDAEQFGEVIREALLNNPDIVSADEKSLAQSVRKCCRDYIIPDGDRGAIVLFGNEARAIPMVAGLEQMVIEQVGAEIRSGVVYEGDNVRVIEGLNPDIQIISDGTDIFTQRKGANVIGAWCWLKFPWEETARLVLYSLDDINRSMAASRMANGPWKIWKDRMSRKACVKSAIWQQRAAIRARGKGSRLLRIIEEDTKAEYGETRVDEAMFGGDTIEGTAVEVQQTQDGDQPAKDKPKPRAQRKAPPAQEKPAPVQETARAEQENPDPAHNDPDPPAAEEQQAQKNDPGPGDDEGQDDGFLPLNQQHGGSAFDDDDDPTRL